MSPDTHDVIRPGQWLSSQRRAPGRARTMGARAAPTSDADTSPLIKFSILVHTKPGVMENMILNLNVHSIY